MNMLSFLSIRAVLLARVQACEGESLLSKGLDLLYHFLALLEF